MIVSAPPIDFHGSIGLWNDTTGEDHVEDVCSYFSRIFRLQNARVAHSDNLCRVLEVIEDLVAGKKIGVGDGN
jgi:hypothetical protein